MIGPTLFQTSKIKELIQQTRKNSERRPFGQILGQLDPKSGPQSTKVTL